MKRFSDGLNTLHREGAITASVRGPSDWKSLIRIHREVLNISLDPPETKRILLKTKKFVNASLRLPSPSIWALSRSIHATTSFDATVAVPGEIYSRALNSLPHRNWCSVDAFSETRQTEWFLSARATRHSELGSTADNFSHTDRRRGLREEHELCRSRVCLLYRSWRATKECGPAVARWS